MAFFYPHMTAMSLAVCLTCSGLTLTKLSYDSVSSVSKCAVYSVCLSVSLNTVLLLYYCPLLLYIILVCSIFPTLSLKSFINYSTFLSLPVCPSSYSLYPAISNPLSLFKFSLPPL